MRLMRARVGERVRVRVRARVGVRLGVRVRVTSNWGEGRGLMG